MSLTRYQVVCRYQRGIGTQRVLTESHWDLGSALEAMLDHQQRRWESVALVPQVSRYTDPVQLDLTLEEPL